MKKGQIINLVGNRYNKLVVIRQVESAGYVTRWLCMCDCGKEHIVRGGNLKNGSVKSCGCAVSEMLINRNTTHSMSGTKVYQTWGKIVDRCFNTKSVEYKNYGGRGINVCDKWRNSFIDFYKDMGEPPTNNHSIDRYPNNNGNYEPMNCRWATTKEQSRNRRSNIIINVNGVNKCLLDWCSEFGIKYGTAMSRIKRGMKPIDAVFLPKKSKWSRHKILNTTKIIYE